MNVLCIGDVMGRLGRRILRQHLARLQQEYDVEFTIANAENVAGGFGLTPATAQELFDLGVDVLTSGNHIWDKREILPFLDQEDALLRPANYPPGVPGKGVVVLPSQSGTYVGVLNLQGRAFMREIDCPFRKADELLPQVRQQTPVIFVDFHAEATAEKLAMGRFLDGRVSALFGTHTHVQTADEQIFPGHTAYITDLGLTGPHLSVIGMEIEGSVNRFLFQIPGRLNPAKHGAHFNGWVVQVDRETGHALHVDRLNFPLDF